MSTDPTRVVELLARCPAAGRTPLLDAATVAAELGVGRLWIKDERGRMGLGSFKALGAAYVIAQHAVERLSPDLDADPDHVAGALRGVTYVTASAGNHGLSVAAGARVFGADAVVVLSHAVSETFARRLRGRGARVVRAGEDYEASMRAAVRLAEDEGAILLSDSSWPGYVEMAARVMEGYLAMAKEMVDDLDQVQERPTHVVLQAGVGGMAASVAAYVRERWGEQPVVAVVEPEAASSVLASIEAGEAVRADGPVSSMGRLDCKEPSILALAALARDADRFVTVDDDQAARTVELLRGHGLVTTASGAAGVAAVQHAAAELGLDGRAQVLTIVTETADDHDRVAH